MLKENEIQEIVGCIKEVLYPHFYQKYSFGNMGIFWEIWGECLNRFTKEEAIRAIKIYASEDIKGVPPTPSQIIQIITEEKYSDFKRERLIDPREGE